MIKKIYYHDTDCGGVVYYANYLKYFEEARTEYLRQKGIELQKLSEQGMLFAVRRVEIDYKAPARYNDTIKIDSRLTKLKNASLEFLQTIECDSKVLVSAVTSLVCINTSFRPCAIPENIIKVLKNDLSDNQ